MVMRVESIRSIGKGVSQLMGVIQGNIIGGSSIWG